MVLAIGAALAMAVSNGTGVAVAVAGCRRAPLLAILCTGSPHELAALDDDGATIEQDTWGVCIPQPTMKLVRLGVGARTTFGLPASCVGVRCCGCTNASGKPGVIGPDVAARLARRALQACLATPVATEVAVALDVPQSFLVVAAILDEHFHCRAQYCLDVFSYHGFWSRCQ